MPRDVNQRAKLTVQMALGEADPEQPVKHAPSVEIGRLGGLVGGKARAAKLSPERRREIAQQAAAARWKPAPG